MVKSIFNYPVHAADSASQRTVPVSEKPHIGAELFPRFESRHDVFPDMENLSFERSIYQRLHDVKLRHADASHSILHVLERHWNEDVGREIALDLHRVLARDALNVQSPTLSAIVLPLSKSCLKERLHNAIDDAKLARNADQTTAIVFSSTVKREAMSVFMTKRGLVVDCFPVGASCDFGKQYCAFCCQYVQNINSEVHLGGDIKMVHSWSDVKLSGQVYSPVKRHLLDADQSYGLGFGTAPLWYLQSMATGPPVQAKLAAKNQEKQASCPNNNNTSTLICE
jgi:hypothetical protein